MNLKIPAKRIFGDNFDPGEWVLISESSDNNQIDAFCVYFVVSAQTCIPLAEFIKQRRAGLHEFIKRIVSNPQLSSQ